MLRVFIGYDPRQPVSFTALSQSIIANTSKPVSITPLILETLPIERQGLTPFTFSRFLVPWLCGYKGWALFLDIDMVVQGDLSELFGLADNRYAVMVSKNKMKFEWASAMLFNCPKCKVLTPEYVEAGENLHGIGWTDKVGEIPPEWNHLVGYDEPRADAKLVHYTQGVPAFPETRGPEYTDEWMGYVQQATSTAPWRVLMGNSVHAMPVVERLIREGKINPPESARGEPTGGSQPAAIGEVNG